MELMLNTIYRFGRHCGHRRRASMRPSGWLDDVYWVNEETDEPFSDGITESIVLLEEDIDRVTVLDSETGS